jgi:hypothetical protein
VPRAAPGEGDEREALVLKRITGNLWKSFTSGTKRGFTVLRDATKR